jgi:hypothetical protein
MYHNPFPRQPLPCPPFCGVSVWVKLVRRDAGFPPSARLYTALPPPPPPAFVGGLPPPPPIPPLAPMPPPPGMLTQRLRMYDSESPPPLYLSLVQELAAKENACNATRKNGTICMAKASTTVDDVLPVCERHVAPKIRGARCQAITEQRRTICRRLVRLDYPYFPLCPEHLEKPPFPCYLMKIPHELRCEIFSYVIPQGMLGNDQSEWIDELENYSSLIRVSRQVHDEVVPLLYEGVNFIARIDHTGLYMCGSPLVRWERGLACPALFTESFPFEKLRRVTIGK